MAGIRHHVLGALELGEYFRVDEAASIAAWEVCEVGSGEGDAFEELKNSLLPTLGACRSGAIIPGDVSRAYCGSLEELKAQISRLQSHLSSHFRAVEQDLLSSLRGQVAQRLRESGPLIEPYFRRLQLDQEAVERLGYVEEVVAHNGWVMDWPATEDFAAPHWRMVYLRRHLQVWTDTVKLRYGESEADAPFVWQYMTDYAVGMAKIFHAIRLDNAHSTPLHVSRHVLARVREVNPHCWVFAELFTGNFHTDLLYQRTLGINALIREAMQCDSPYDLGQKLQSPFWNGHPVGALSPIPTLDRVPPAQRTQQKHLSKCPSRTLLAAPARAVPLLPRHCPALLFDCTHDNQTPAEKRHPRDALPNAALVAASCASLGSVRGYDELFPKNPSVVSERRAYQAAPAVEEIKLGGFEGKVVEVEKEKEFKITWHRKAQKVVARGAWDGWSADLNFNKDSEGLWSAVLRVETHRLPLQYKFIVDDQWTINEQLPLAADEHGNHNNVLSLSESSGISGPDAMINTLPGILTVKQVLNQLHQQLGKDGYTEIEVRFLADDTLAIQRRSPDNSHSVWFVIRCAHWRNRMGDGLNAQVLELDGAVAHLHVAATLFVGDQHESGYQADLKVVTGMECFLHLYGALHEVADVWQEGGNSKLRLRRFPPGSVVVFSTDASSAQVRHQNVMDLLSAQEIFEPLQGLELHHLNYLLYSCEAEERDRTEQRRGAYVVPGHGPLAYCGLMGVCALLDEARRSSTEDKLLEHALLQHLRSGDWLVKCLAERLGDFQGLEPVEAWLEKAAEVLMDCPRSLKPFYFDLLVPGLCAAACTSFLDASTDFVALASSQSELVRDLALATAQFWGATKSAPLHWEKAQKAGARWRFFLVDFFVGFGTAQLQNVILFQ